MNFNIFKVLEKDNKELIHSSFLNFLIKEDSNFANNFLGIDLSPNYTVKLESSYTYGRNKKKKRCRFDLEILEKERIIIIENKFKSFPIENQLIEYDLALKEKFPTLSKKKYLICFDAKLFNGYKDWIIKDYKNLLEYLKDYISLVVNTEKKIFITHYIDFLKEYDEKYSQFKISATDLFKNQFDNTNKFWIRLLYSNIEVELSKYFKSEKIETQIYIAPGNTSVPLLNITPKHWKLEGVDLLIQIQNGDFKFYAHTENKEFLRKMILFSKSKLVSEHLKYKNVGNKKEKTAYIFKINIHQHLKENEELTISLMIDWIISYYKSIDIKVINNYNAVDLVLAPALQSVLS
ncbi:PD-(D/E)XK nuclease family protein [Pseudomonas shirazensis]